MEKTFSAKRKNFEKLKLQRELKEKLSLTFFISVLLIIYIGTQAGMENLGRELFSRQFVKSVQKAEPHFSSNWKKVFDNSDTEVYAVSDSGHKGFKALFLFSSQDILPKSRPIVVLDDLGEVINLGIIDKQKTKALRDDLMLKPAVKKSKRLLAKHRKDWGEKLGLKAAEEEIPVERPKDFSRFYYYFYGSPSHG